MNKLLIATAVGAVPVAWAALPPAPFDLERDVACVMPSDVLFYAEAPGFPDLCDQGLKHPLVKTILRSPLGEMIQEETGMPPFLALQLLNGYAGRPVLPALAKLTAEGLAVGVKPADEAGEVIACIVARGDAQLWEEVIADAMKKVAEANEYPEERVVKPHREIRGMDVWFLGDTGAFAHKDGLFVGATSEEVLREMIDLGSESGISGLASREDFTAARADYRSEEAFLWGWADLDGIEAMTDGGLADLRAAPNNPGAQFLLGPSISNLCGASEAALEVRFQDRSIELDIVGIDTPGEPMSLLLAPESSTPPALPAATDNEALRGVFYRDMTGMFRERVELFPTSAQPAFAEAISNLALFFGGQDVTDEVLPAIDPWIGLISRPIAFEEGRVPEVPLPGAALLIGVNDPESLGPQLTSAVQSLLSILNIDAAENLEPILTVKLELHEGVTVTYGQYAKPAEGEGVDLRYNLEPACAMVNDTFVIGTHRSLVKELVGQLQRGELAAAAVTESLELSGPEISQVIDANEEALVINAVLSEGKTEKVARNEIRGLKTITEMVESLSFETARPAARDLRASLKLLLEGN